jgi:hypothetical protein
MNTKQKTKWWVDVALFAGLIISFFLDFTGVAVHQWIGIAIGALAAYHLLAHWGWVSSVTRRFFAAASGKARLFYLVDAAVLGGLALIVGTGLAISTWLDLSLANYSAWLLVHITASIATLLAVILKLGLHGRWIASTTRKVIARPAAIPNKKAPPQPAGPPAGAGSMSRQDFIKVMGVVSLASFLALTNATESLGSLPGAGTTASTSSQPSSSPASSSPASSPATSTPTASSPSASSSSSSASSASSQSSAGVSSSASSASSACAVRCGRGCSYPGHCGRYTDTNNNSRCDFGECL